MVTHLLAAIMASGLAVGATAAPVHSDPTIDTAAQAFRLQVYQTFHADRAEFNARNDQWSALEKKWEQQGKPERWRTELVRWLAEATDDSRVGAVRPLPPEPLGVVVDAALDNDGALGNSLQSATSDGSIDSDLLDDGPQMPAEKSTAKNGPELKHNEPLAKQAPKQAVVSAPTVVEKRDTTPTWLESVREHLGRDVGNLLGGATPPAAAAGK